MRLLLDYPWPGNVRELENAIEHATVLAKGNRIEITDLPAMLRSPVVSPIESHGTMQKNEISLLRDVLEECNWNKKQAARRLGISRGTLYNKLKKYQIEKLTVH
jgi:two-component system response regulator HydG